MAAADWSSLHQDLLSRIFLLLACIADGVRFSAVCKHWRSIALQDPPPLPWLLTPSTAGTSCYRIFGGFRDLPSSFAGEARGARFCGSSPGGWFVVALHHLSGHALLNLRSGERVPLPDRVCFLEQPPAAPQPEKDVLKCPIMLRCATMSAAPPSAACLVAALTAGQTTMAFWRPGMDCWLAAPQGPPCDPQDLTFYDGCFWAVNSGEQLFCYKPEISGADGTLTVQHIVYKSCAHEMTLEGAAGPGETVSRYLLPNASGTELLMVKRFIAAARGLSRFEVFSLNKQQQGRPLASCWRFYEMDGQVLFIGRGCSKAFDTGHSSRPGYIYFLDDVYHGGPLTILQQKQYPCADTGAWCCSPDNEEIKRCLPWVRPSDSSPSIWGKCLPILIR